MMRMRYRGFGPFQQLRQFDRQLGEWWQSLPEAARNSQNAPALNLWDDGEQVIAEAELPGVNAESLEITVGGKELTVAGERTSLGGEGILYLRRERTTGKFARTVELPCEVASDRVEANLENGVLTVRMPKSEAAKPRKIDVQTK